MCKCANVQMCKWSHFVAALVDEFINVQMGEMCKCANAWLMCKCANVQMCKWSHFVAALVDEVVNVQMGAERLSCTKATICTFAHSHICTLTKHLHINQAFSH